MSSDTEHFQALADNLIQTLGSDRAVHVANQFGWYGVADEIARRKNGENAFPQVSPQAAQHA